MGTAQSRSGRETIDTVSNVVQVRNGVMLHALYTKNAFLKAFILSAIDGLKFLYFLLFYSIFNTVEAEISGRSHLQLLWRSYQHSLIELASALGLLCLFYVYALVVCVEIWDVELVDRFVDRIALLHYK